MNNRIRELADQVELTIRTSKGTYMSHPEFNKKFAELIVRECSDILRKEAESNWEGREERLLNAMANWIENHFGIEE